MFSRLGREDVVGVEIKGMRRPLVDVSRGLVIVDMIDDTQRIMLLHFNGKEGVNWL